MPSRPSPSSDWSVRQSSAQKSFSKIPSPAFAYGLDILSHTGEMDFDTILSFAQKDALFSVNQTFDQTISVLDFPSAQKKFPFIQKKLGTLLSLDNKFESFHLANVKNILVIVVPENVHASSPLSIVPGAGVFEHILIYVQKNASITLLHNEKDIQPHPCEFHSTAVEIFAEENARVTYTSTQTYTNVRNHFAFKRAHVEKNASVDWFWSEFGSTFSKLDVTSFLVGENASSKNIGIFLGNAAQVSDIHAAVHHLAPRTHSELLARGVLDDSSKNIYRGLVKMTKDAPGSVGPQRADVLLLSPSSEADPVPMLEIEGSDIRCTHAATVSRMDASKLFYLASRGIDESSARSLYINGFLSRLLEHFPIPSIVSESRSRIARKLGIAPLHEEESFLHSPEHVFV